ncbi:helix-turn-helix domain-containing protein [Longispora fulva]|uniref:helix-turn-helix domain-containing protein n=1 Tax=Longispora fulva TaxID=619741 RepID=UPI001E3005A6|nr:helix-turn-helix transcriptional regulator [Longispora fulva]
METFGQALRRLRDERGFSLRGLGKKASFDYSYLSQVERDARWPSRDVPVRCDFVLGSGDTLTALYDREERARVARRLAGRQPTPAHTATVDSESWASLPVPTLGTLINQGRDAVERARTPVTFPPTAPAGPHPRAVPLAHVRRASLRHDGRPTAGPASRSSGRGHSSPGWRAGFLTTGGAPMCLVKG